MGILNVTPDSFSDGGKYFSRKNAISRAEKLLKDGADIIDVGGESTFAGSKHVTLEEELKRVIPVVSGLVKMGATVSVDTYKAEVARACLELGASIINDITALRGDSEMINVLKTYKPKIVIMYSKDNSPRLSLENKIYDNVIFDIKSFLSEKIRYLVMNGIPKKDIIIDPGLGFFLSGLPNPSYQVLNHLDEFKDLGCEILVSPSKKSFLGGDIQNRGIKTLVASAIAIYNGADYVRVHEVAEHIEVRETVYNFLKYVGN